MKKRKANRKKIGLLIAILVLLVVLIIISSLISHIEKSNDKSKVIEDYGYETIPVQNPTENYVPEKAIRYSNISVLTSLKGELPTSTVTKIVKSVFVEELPLVLKKVDGYNEAKLKEYYNENAQDIADNLRVVSEEEFIKMINLFKGFTSDLTTDYKSCEFTNKDDLGLKFTYENGEEFDCKIVGTNSNLITFEF